MEALNDANSLCVQDQFTDAIGLYQQALNDQNYAFEAYLGLATSYLQIGDLENAEIAANKAIELNSSSYLPHLRKGQALFYQQKFRDALDAFEEAETCETESAKSWVYKCKSEIHKM